MATEQLSREQLEQRAKARIEMLRRVCRSKEPVQFEGRQYACGLDCFIQVVFSKSFDKFIYGTYLTEVAQRLDANTHTMDISARDHFKSTRLYAEIMRDVFCTQTDIECHYFSYQQTMSEYHLKKVKQFIRSNPYFAGIRDLNPTAQSAFVYDNGEGQYSAHPAGLLSFKRGLHCERVYIDDPLKDPENKLAPTSIYKINNVIKLEIFAMVKSGGICRVVGTPQTNNDFFFDKGLRTRFDVSFRPAIVNEKRKEVLFKEWKDYEELDRIRRTIGAKAFAQEYLCSPAYSENSYIEREQLLACVDDTIKQVNAYEGDSDVVAGFDIGKKTHPSHFTVFERKYVNGEYHYKQLAQKFLDGVDYNEQVNLLKQWCDAYQIDVLRYDNTRAEFELYAEQKLLPECMKPVTFTFKQNNAMAVNFSRVIGENRVQFINDERQIDQILQVNNDLQALESPLGHGDSFWSNALALIEEKEPEYSVRVL